MQEVVALEPDNAIALSHLSKAWSDVMYLAQIKGKTAEVLTREAREECNQIALAYSEKVIPKLP